MQLQFTHLGRARVLGHHLDEAGSSRTCSTHALTAMSKAFFANLSPGLRTSSMATKLRFLRSCICTIAKFRWARWPYTVTLASKLDASQRRFLYSLFPISPASNESLEDFFARRHRTAARLASSTGKWSDMWAADLSSWHSHVVRAHDTHAWSPHILKWRGHDWLRLQRLWHSSVGESRTNTRAYRGCVHRRWEEGLEHITSA